MNINTNDIIIMFSWLQARMDKVGGAENLALSEMELAGRIIESNKEIMQVFREIQAQETMKSLFNWADNLPDDVKQAILKL
jgi:hypothetical protein